jgi:hypothetical protein
MTMLWRGHDMRVADPSIAAPESAYVRSAVRGAGRMARLAAEADARCNAAANGEEANFL